MRAGVVAAAAVALAVGLSACASDTATEGSATTEPTTETTSAAPTTSAQASGPEAGPKMTIDEYVAQNGIVQTPVLPDDPDAPAVTLPIAQGWEDMGEQSPPGAYRAMVFTADPAAAADPPTLIAAMSKLTGEVDQAKIMEYAPSDVQNMPEFQGMNTGQPSDLAGFDATLIGGFYTKDGTTRMIAQKTVVIPAEDGIYLLNVKADGPEAQQGALIEATSLIDEQATIVP